jgi:hypothetical protein
MKTLDELKRFYETDLRAELQQLEAKRKQVMQNSLIIFAVIVGLGLVLGIAVLSATGQPVVLLFGIILCAVIGGIIFSFLGRDYKAEFKQKIIGGLVRFIEPGLSYQPQNSVSQDLFKQSGLFNHRIDRYKGEDCVFGKVDKTEILFSELHAEYKTTSGTGKNRHTEWHTIFKGLFFIADFNKHFQGRTVVLPDTAQKLFGNFGQTLQSMAPGRDQLIKLEDPEFENHFVVYSTDQIEARYILSPSLMQRISEFKQKTGTQIHLSFMGSKVFVAVSLAKNMFEPAYFSSSADFKCIQDYFQDLTLAIGIVDDLNLNTRIWTKN